MANGRSDRSKVDKGRDPGRFIGLPVSVLESTAYLGLSANARSLLLVGAGTNLLSFGWFQNADGFAAALA